ncbi:MAG: MBL fold metallo-hydrolase [Candidatus Paceibacterota bacterium]
MVITHYGGEFFKVTFGDTTLAFNPPSKDSKLKGAKFGADIAFVSANHPDFNGIDQVSHGEKKPFVISGPGEYEIREIFIKGFPLKTEYGGREMINTIYYVTLEGMTLLFLGALNQKELSHDAKAGIEEVNILFVPVGGDGVLDPEDAHELSVSLESNIVIPMHADDIGEKGSLENFLKEEGGKVSPVEKLTLKKKDLEGKMGEVVVLKS